MTIFEYIVSGGVLGLIGLMFKNNYDNDKKVSRVYRRLDEVKNYQEENFTRKDICSVLHKTIDNKLDKMDAKLDKLLNNERHPS